MNTEESNRPERAKQLESRITGETLQRWALIAEIVGGIAVVFSLIFVGLQIRQSSQETSLNTRAIEVGAYQELTNQILKLNSEVYQNTEFSELYTRVRACGDYSSPAERVRISMYVTNLYRHADTSFHQFQLGILEKERLDQMLQIFVDALREFWPAQVIWNARSTNGNNIPEFEEYVSSYTRSRGAWEPVCAEVSGVTRMLT